VKTLPLCLLLIALCCSVSKSVAQEKSIVLKNKNNGSVFEVDPEKAIKYRVQEGSSKKGFIEEVGDEFMVIDGERIEYHHLTQIVSWHTRKNQSAKTGGVLLTGFGGVLTTAGVVVTAASAEEGGLGAAIGVPVGAVATIVGLGSTYLGLRALKRKRFDMGEWDLVVNHY